MSNVIVKENETLDSALRRFKRNCAKAGIQQEIRKREHYEKPSVKRKRNLKQLENVNTTSSKLIERTLLWKCPFVVFLECRGHSCIERRIRIPLF